MNMCIEKRGVRCEETGCFWRYPFISKIGRKKLKRFAGLKRKTYQTQKSNKMAYVPPNKRDQMSNKSNKQSKKQRKQMTDDDFPAFGAPAATADTSQLTMRYAAAVETVEPKPVVAERIEPGWVKLKRNKATGKIDRFGEPPYVEDEGRRRDVTLNNLVNKWQEERDAVTDVLDQASPYWGQKDLRAALSDDDLSESESEGESEYDSDGGDWSDGWTSN